MAASQLPFMEIFVLTEEQESSYAVGRIYPSTTITLRGRHSYEAQATKVEGFETREAAFRPSFSFVNE